MASLRLKSLKFKVGSRRVLRCRKRGVFGHYKKRIFHDIKNDRFFALLKIVSKRVFQAMNTGWWQVPHFSFLVKNGSKTGSKKYRVKPTVGYRFGVCPW